MPCNLHVKLYVIYGLSKTHIRLMSWNGFPDSTPNLEVKKREKKSIKSIFGLKSYFPKNIKPRQWVAN